MAKDNENKPSDRTRSGLPLIKPVAPPAQTTPTVPSPKPPTIDAPKISTGRTRGGLPIIVPSPTKAITPAAPAQKKQTFQQKFEKEVNKQLDAAGGATVGVLGGFIDAISTGLSYGSGKEKAIRELTEKGVITESMRVYLLDKISGPTGANSETVALIPKATVVGTEEADRINKFIEKAAWANATAWTRGEKVNYGLETLFGEKKNYTLDEYVAGITYDIINDPLTFAGSGAVSAVKGLVKGGAAAVKAGTTAALKSEVSREAAMVSRFKQTREAEALPVAKVKEPKVKIKQSEIETARALGVDVASEVERIRRLGTYTTTPIPPTISFGPVKLNLGLVTSSALEAGQKALLSSLRSDLARETLSDVLKGNVSSTAGVVVARQGEEWIVKTSSGENIGTRATKEDAKALAKETKANANSKQVGEVSVDQLPVNAARQTEDGVDAVDVPAEGGGSVQLEKNTPHQATDGSVWIYDGTKVKVFADMDGAQASLVQKAQAPKATVKKTKGVDEYIVRAGDYIETFKTKAEASAAAAAYNTGKVVTPSRVASGKKPALDLTPTPQFTFADLGKGKVTTKEGTVLKKILKKVDELASKTPGRKIRLAMTNQRLLRRIIRDGTLTDSTAMRYLHRALRKDFDNAIKLAKVEGELETPYTLMKTLQATAKDNENINWISSLVSNIVIRVDNSLVPLSKLPERFPNYIKDVPNYVAKQVADKLKQIMDEAATLAKAKDPIARTETKVYDSLVSVFGEDIANQVKATGILKGFSAEANKQFELLEARLLNQYENVTYKNLDELIAGLRNGESVNSDSLLRIFKEIDPENQITKSTLKAMEGGTGTGLRNIFLNEVPQTVADMRVKVAVAGDVSELMKANGISYDDLLAQAIKFMQEPTPVNAIELAGNTSITPEWIQDALSKESASALAQQFSDSISPATGRTWNEGDDMVTLALRESWTNKFNYTQVIEQSEDYIETVSSLGQKVKKVSDQNYVSPNGAVLPNVFTQADEFRMVMKLTALIRARISKGIKSKGKPNVLTPANKLGKEKQLELRNAGADRQIDEFIYQMDQASRLLGILGVRITRLKEANDFTFDAAYKAERAAAKAEGRKPNYNKAADAHFAYVHMGDIFRAFDSTGGRDILRQAFFPVTGPADYDKNTMGFMGFGDAARRVLELDGKESIVDKAEIAEELVTRILSKSEKMKTPTPAFKARQPEIAAAMAEHLLKPETIAALREAHLVKAVASADRWVREAQTISDDVLNSLREGMRAADSVGETSDYVRLEVVRQYLRRLALAGNIFAAQGGRYAEDIFTAYAMQFAQYGKLPLSPDAPAGTIIKILDDQEKSLLRTQLYLLDMHVAPERAQAQAAAGLKYKKPAELEAVQDKLTLAQEQFEEVMSRIGIVRDGGTQEVAAWEKEYQQVKKALEKARKSAAESGIQTFHYQAGTWVPSDQYDPTIARQLAEEMERAYVAGEAGRVARTMVDETPVVPEFKVLSGKKLQEALKRENIILTNARVANSVKHGEEIAAAMSKEIGKYDQVIDDPAVSAMQELQELELKQLSADMDMPPVVHYADEIIPEVMRVDVEFDSFFKGDKAVATGQLAERFSSFRNKEDLIALARKEETSGMLRTSNTAQFLTRIQREYRDTAPADFADALGYAISRGEIPKSVQGVTREIAMKIRPMIGPIRQALSEMNKNGLMNAIERFGLKDFLDPKFDEKSMVQSMESVFEALPFVKAKNIKTDEEQLRLRRLGESLESGLHPIQLFENLVKAISVTKAEQGLAANIVANFGWKNQFNSYKEAVDAGWVAIESAGIGQKSNIINALPSPKDGALFPPEIAGQVGAVVRHWNEMVTKPRNEFVKQVSQWTGLAKVFMTVNRLGYHTLNLVSDLSTAVIRGTSPADMILGTRLASRYIARTLPAEYGGLTDFVAKRTGMATALEQQLRLVTKSWGADADAIAKADAEGFAPTIRLVGAGGNVKRTKLDPDELVEGMTRRGIFEKNVFVNAIQGLDDSLILDARDLEKAKFGQKVGARVARATQIAGKVGGDFASVYSNAIRAAHANKIIQSRSWRSLDEALDFVADELAIFHPTNKSLGSFERRNSAVISSFYTWLRMAHVMAFKMAMENSRELYAINNALYYLNSLNGEQPQSRGTSFANPEGVADWFRYRSGQVILPGMTEEGALGIRTPFALYEVVNNWQFNYDTAKSLNENVAGSAQQLGKTLARMTPIAFQTGFKVATGRDIATGQTVARETVGDYAAILAGLFPAATGPARGFTQTDLPVEIGKTIDKILGAPAKPDTTEEITPDQALIARLNNLLGVAAFQPESEASKKRAKQLETERKKREREIELQRRKERRRRRREGQ
jgi:hypothetical protein